MYQACMYDLIAFKKIRVGTYILIPKDGSLVNTIFVQKKLIVWKIKIKRMDSR